MRRGFSHAAFFIASDGISKSERGQAVNSELPRFSSGVFFRMRPNATFKHLTDVYEKKTAGRKETDMKKEQLGALIIASEDTLYRVAKTLLRNDEDCRDAIQEAIVKAFSSVGTLKNDKYAKTWMIRILINECYGVMRKQKRIVPFDEAAEKMFMDRAEADYTELYDAIMTLPEEMRLTVTLYYLEGYSVRETADLLERTESTIKNRLARARKRLRKILEDEEAAI